MTQKQNQHTTPNRHTAVQRDVVGDFTFWEREDKAVKNAPVLVAFQDEAETAYTVAKTLVEQLQLPLIGEVKSRSFPPMTIVCNGQVTGPMRVYGDARLVVILASFNVKGDMAHDITQLIFNFIDRHELSHVISVEGVKQKLELPPGVQPPKSETEMAMMGQMLLRRQMDKGEDTTQPKFWTTDDSAAEVFRREGSESLENVVVGGVTGALMNEVLYRPTLHHTVVFPTYSPFFTDVSAAAKAVRMLRLFFPSLSEATTGKLDDMAGVLQDKLRGVVSELEGDNSTAACASMSMYS